jgi:predicted nucleotidyltransferase
MAALGPCNLALMRHEGLTARRRRSAEQRHRVTQAFAGSSFLESLPISVFCAGSLARQEMGDHSDLDVFVTADRDARLESRLCEYTLFAEVININNKDLQFPEFSNDGQYLKICFIDDLKRLTGSPSDDSENIFTTRMLLLLESVPVLHEETYQNHIKLIAEHYYRDDRGKRTFRPLFLLNDLLRYWRTLCLNYEERRHDPTKKWRKKNVNLKFSRMVTVFSTVLPLTAELTHSADELVQLCQRPALERLAAALDHLDDEALTRRWPQILDLYEEFLTWKEAEDVDRFLEDGPAKERVRQHAETLSLFLHDALTHAKIKPELRRYLIL